MTSNAYQHRIQQEMVEVAQAYLNGGIGFIEAVRAMVDTVVDLEGRESDAGVSLVLYDSEIDGLPSIHQYHLWDEKVLNEKIKAKIIHAEAHYKDDFVIICKYLIDLYSDDEYDVEKITL